MCLIPFLLVAAVVSGKLFFYIHLFIVTFKFGVYLTVYSMCFCNGEWVSEWVRVNALLLLVLLRV